MAAALCLQRQSLAANPFLFSAHGLRYRKLEVILTTNIDGLDGIDNHEPIKTKDKKFYERSEH
ncbi:hypothetical protein ZEAMMB73_Zm00001d031373 [Zea mays]|uniref:Uncharacterized protein n=1 Tax=Zea mays TaxID=4577 RepID=A0A1D6KIH1_MAIZE|nr:hypothetical protein ZEAMMB73_Zm00001d031373 [Zea mays]